MNEIYQALVAVNPLTLIAQICNLFLQLIVVKIFFLDKIKAVLDQRREKADREISDAQNAKAQAMALRETYEASMKSASAQADEILIQARKTASSRSEEIIGEAQAQAARIRERCAADIALEKKRAINDAKDEISGISMAIAETVLGRQLTAEDHLTLINRFIDDLGDGL